MFTLKSCETDCYLKPWRIVFLYTLEPITYSLHAYCFQEFEEVYFVIDNYPHYLTKWLNLILYFLYILGKKESAFWLPSTVGPQRLLEPCPRLCGFSKQQKASQSTISSAFYQPVLWRYTSLFASSDCIELQPFSCRMRAILVVSQSSWLQLTERGKRQRKQ